MHFALFVFYREDGWISPINFFAFQILACFRAIMGKVWTKPMHIECMIGETSWKENTNFPACCDAFPHSVLHSDCHVTCLSGKGTTVFLKLRQISKHTKTSQVCFFWMLAAQDDNWFGLWRMVRCMYGMENNTLHVRRGKSGQPSVLSGNFPIHALLGWQTYDCFCFSTWLLIASSNKRIIFNILTTKLELCNSFACMEWFSI